MGREGPSDLPRGGGDPPLLGLSFDKGTRPRPRRPTPDTPCGPVLSGTPGMGVGRRGGGGTVGR